MFDKITDQWMTCPAPSTFKQISIFVQVEDVNDCVPRFLSPMSSVSIGDTSGEGDFVAIMSVEDQVS